MPLLGKRSWFARLLTSMVAVSTMAVVTVPLVASTATRAGAVPPPPVGHSPNIALYAGYAGDATGSFWTGYGFNPRDMWAWSPGVQFYGVSSNLDAAAVRIDNLSTGPMTFDKVIVTSGTSTYDLWPANMALPAGGHLILTGTVPEPGENFDLSDSIDCTAPVASLPVPVVSVTIGGATYSYPDLGRRLFDLPSCNNPEGEDWEVMAPGFPSATRPESDQRGNGNSAETQVTCGVNAADPVNCATGNLWETVDDLAVPGRGPALDMERTYNSMDAATASVPGAVGWGWTDSFAQKLVVDATSGAVTVTQGNGATVTFTPFAGSYVAPGWVLATLIHNGDGTWTFTMPDQSAERFDSSGRLVSETDRNGYTTTMAYSGSRLATVTEQAGRTLTMTYDASGRLATVADPAGRTVGYGYDAAGNLTAVTDPAGHVTHYDYDAAHRLTTTTDPNGGVTTNVYDGANRVTSQTDPLGRTTTLSYSGSTTAVTDPAGNVTTKTFDGQGNLTMLTQGTGTPQAATWTYTYDPFTAERSTTTDPLGHVTVERWDPYGNRLSLTDPLERTTTWTYDALNDMTSVTDPLGVTTTNTYDLYGNLLSSSTLLTGTSQAATTTFTYDPLHPGDLATVTDPVGKVWRYVHDSAGNVTRTEDPLGDATTYGYNSIGQRTSRTSPRGNQPGAVAANFTTSYSYTPNGDLQTVTDPLGATSTLSYDANRNRVSERDANGHTTSYVYDRASQLTETHRADGTVVKTTYDTAGNVASQIDGLNKTTSYGYDPLNRPTSVTDPAGRTTHYGYDPLGHRVTKTDPGGTCPAWPITYPPAHGTSLSPGQQCTLWHYDAAGQQISTEYSEGTTPNLDVTYDVDGQPTLYSQWGGGLNNHGRNMSLQYDSLHRLTMTDGDPFSTPSTEQVQYGYDLAGHLTSLSYPPGALGVIAGTVTRTYDPAGRLASVKDWDGATTSFSYDADSDLTGEQHPNGLVDTTSYDRAGRPSEIRTVNPQGLPLLDLPYGRDNGGQITSANPTPAPSPTATTSYGYDPANRLTTISTPNALVTAPIGGYTYDAADRLTSKNIAGLQTTFGYDQANQLATATNSAVSSTFSYDTRGNRLQRTDTTQGQQTVTTYGYDQANRLTSFESPALHAAATPDTFYQYTGDGLLSADTVGEIFWNRADPLPTMMSDGITAYYITGPDGLPIERIDATGKLYYQHDALGSTRALTGQNGAVIQSYTYDPYGKATVSGTASGAAAIANPFQYAGQYTDPISGLVYMRARWYDPTTAQFLTRDPLEAATRSAYGYVAGNPLNLTDPTGLFWGEGTFRRVANDVYHPVRAAVTGPVSAVTLGVDYGYSLLPGRDVDCNWNSRNWVAVCSGGPTILDAPATTFGGVINTELNYNDFLQANDCRLMAHETKHTDQWAIFGPGFAGLDAVAAGGDWIGSEIFGWKPGAHNPFEIWAGLKDGGYK